MSTTKYILMCNHCSYKRWTDGTDLDDLVMVETCKSCSGSKKFKCPECGYLIKPIKYVQPPDPTKHRTRLR